MQSKLANKNAPHGTLLGLAAATLLLAGAQSVLGQGASPVGFWDVVESGARGGVATMQFLSDGTFSINQIIVPNLPRNSTPDIGREGELVTRTGANTGGGGTPLPAHTNLFGQVQFPRGNFTNTVPNSLPVVDGDGTTITNIPYLSTNIIFSGVPAGQWGFNTDGKLIGFLTEMSSASASITNVVASITNDYGTYQITTTTVSNNIPITNTIPLHVTNIVYTTNITADRLTNAISFTGKVVPNQRLTLNLQTPGGTVIFRGLPPMHLADATGQWYGRKQNQGLTFYEFFDLTPDLDPDTLNTYIIQGSGPGYVFGPYTFEGTTYTNGTMIISRQKKFGIAANVFALGELPQPPVVVRAVTGPINVGRRSFSGAKGIQSNDSSNFRFNYNGAIKTQ